MGVVIPQTVPASEDRASGAQVIDGSLRFNSSKSHYLSRTFSAGNRKTFTWSAWLKRSSLAAADHYIFGAYGTKVEVLRFQPSTDKLQLLLNGGNTANLATTQVFRDFSAWYHIVFAVDTTQATASNRIKLYVNGNQITAFSTETYPSLNYDSDFNNTIEHQLGATLSSGFYNGHLTNVYLIDGQALDASYFGFTDPLTNTWRPKKYVRTSTITGDTGGAVGFGTNGFYLPFDTDGAGTIGIGTDRSGKGNHWTINNFVTTAAGIQTNPNIMPDSPSGVSYSTAPTSGIGTTTGMTKPSNYCTLNPLFRGAAGATYSNGNLSCNTGNANGHVRGNIGITTGKYYFEAVGTANVVSAGMIVGIVQEASTPTYNIGGDGLGYGYFTDGLKANSGYTSYGSSWTTGDIIGVAFDATNGALTFYKNGVSQGVAFTGLFSSPYFPAVSDTTSGDGVGFDINFGQKSFKYAPPAGFLPLCTANLPRPTIVRPDQFVGIVTYTGNGGTQSLNVGFKPDFVWIKNRDAGDHSGLFDSIRGPLYRIVSDYTYASTLRVNTLTSFNTNGFTVGSAGEYNRLNERIVAWAWKAGGNSNTYNINDIGYSTASAAGLTAGTITPTAASINTKSGFSIITWNGSGASGTLSHGLGNTPGLIFLKGTSSGEDGQNWRTYHSALGTSPSNTLFLNLTDASSSHTGRISAVGTSTFTLSSGGAGVNASGQSYIAYLWAEIPGFSKFGSYTGNGSSDGPMVVTGFRPTLIIIKGSSSTTSWNIVDRQRLGYNVNNYRLFAESASAENATGILDFTANGFKIRNTGGDYNDNAQTYTYAAYAEAPTQNLFGGQSNAR